MPNQKANIPAVGQYDLDDEAFRASLAPFHDEHVRDRYWHAACPQCAAEEAAQLEAKTAKAAARKAARGI